MDETKRQVLLSNIVKGGLFGYFILHPFTMIINEIMHLHPGGDIHLHTFDLVLSSYLRSFNMTMLPWAIASTLFGAAVGYYYGTIHFQLEKQKTMLKGYSEKLEKKVEERTRDLIKSEWEHRTLMEQASDGIFVSDQQGNYLEVNSMAGLWLVIARRNYLSSMLKTSSLLKTL